MQNAVVLFLVMHTLHFFLEMALEFDLFCVEGILYANGPSSTDLLAVVSGFVATSQESPSEPCSLNCHCLKMQCHT